MLLPYEVHKNTRISKYLLSEKELVESDPHTAGDRECTRPPPPPQPDRTVTRPPGNMGIQPFTVAAALPHWQLTSYKFTFLSGKGIDRCLPLEHLLTKECLTSEECLEGCSKAAQPQEYNNAHAKKKHADLRRGV